MRISRKNVTFLLLVYVLGFVLAPGLHVSVDPSTPCEDAHASTDGHDDHGEEEGGHCGEHCATCRVLVSSGPQDLVPPSMELRTLPEPTLHRAGDPCVFDSQPTSAHAIRGPPGTTV